MPNRGCTRLGEAGDLGLQVRRDLSTLAHLDEARHRELAAEPVGDATGRFLRESGLDELVSEQVADDDVTARVQHIQHRLRNSVVPGLRSSCRLEEYVTHLPIQFAGQATGELRVGLASERLEELGGKQVTQAVGRDAGVHGVGHDAGALLGKTREGVIVLHGLCVGGGEVGSLLVKALLHVGAKGVFGRVGTGVEPGQGHRLAAQLRSKPTVGASELTRFGGGGLL